MSRPVEDEEHFILNFVENGEFVATHLMYGEKLLPTQERTLFRKPSAGPSQDLGPSPDTMLAADPADTVDMLLDEMNRPSITPERKQQIEHMLKHLVANHQPRHQRH